MAQYRKTFTKQVWGEFIVKANSSEEAQEKFDNGDYDEYDNKTEIIEEGDEWTK